MASAHVFLLCPLSIGTKHQALSLYLVGKLFKRSGQVTDVVTFLPQPPKQIVKGRYHLHATGQERILSRTFEVGNCYALFVIRLGAEQHTA